MIVEQMYTNCLAQAAYWIESDGEAAVVDPLRDYHIYIEKAKNRNVKIKYILETHFHADFVSGHLDLSKATGAPIIYGPEATTGFDCQILNDREQIKIGKLTIEVLHTPGHTIESSCYLLKDEHNTDYCLFSGDTLFVGDVGRPDLLDKNQQYTKEIMASWLYDSLYKKIMHLSDNVILYPAHGPGSSCGKNLGPETFSTIGKQKEENYALQSLSRETFIEQVLEGIKPPPGYFFEDAFLNKNGYENIDLLKEKGLKNLSLAEFDFLQKEGVLIIDSRIPDIFQEGFIPSSINIGLNGQYAIWAAELFNLDRKIMLVCTAGQEEESVIRLTRVGFNNIIGFLEGGFIGWKNAGKGIDMIVSIDAEEFCIDYKLDAIQLIDVRKESEYDTLHLANAKLISLNELINRTTEVEKNKSAIYVHCAGGYRSMIAASILKRAGFDLVKNVLGGFNLIKEDKSISFSSNIASNVI